jgi:16S rRNA (adenine1518-N6/adenine1519-N6)-dimethyltransferase
VLDPRVLLRRHGLTPKKSFGQNFLIAEPVAHAIAVACVPDDVVGRAVVVELGAGAGALTSLLAARAKHTIAVERDRELVPVLTDAFETEVTAGTVRIVEGDAQTVDYPGLFAEAEARFGPMVHVLAGNLPYQITGSLLENAVVAADSLDRVIFMVQEEVAERLAASPGTKEYGALTVFVRAAFDVKKIRTVSRNCFFPAPEVTSAVVLLTPVRPRRAIETELFRKLVKGAFGMRRKTLRNAWQAVAERSVLDAAARLANVSLDARGETLDVEAFARMEAALRSQP